MDAADLPVPPLEPLPEDWATALAVVAHPDDMEYGASAAVARWTDQGKRVAYLLVTAGEAGIDGLAPEEAGPLRAEEQRAACAAVGVDDLEILDHPDGMLVPGLDLRRDIAAAIRRVRPELVVTLNHHDTFGPGALNMADHKVTGLAVIDAVRDAANRWVFRDLAEHQGLEPWGGVRWVAVANSPVPTHAVPVGEGDVERAVASLEAHRAYLDGLGGGAMADPGAFLRGLFASAAPRFAGTPAMTFELLPM
ncbi:MAG TPA: PIG-L deacetylase family protein [Acidimicrobiales bacterium]|nr:PIG-L deacetylase family protein [Acidimicrobiales bacterium]